MRDEFRLNSISSALLVVDLTQEGLHGFSSQESRDIISQIDNFIDQTGIRPIYCNTMWDENPSLSNRPRIRQRAVWGSAPSLFSMEVSKKLPSAFRYDRAYNVDIPSDLDQFLKKYGIMDVFVVGVEKPLCVWETAIDSAIIGYNTALIEDLCFTSEFVKRSAMPDIKTEANIKILNTVDFIRTPNNQISSSNSTNINPREPL